jgi:hypothetical protein
MTLTDWTAVLALVISSGGFALNLRNFLMSGPRLRLTVMADAVEFPDDDGDDKLALVVTNRGDVQTVLTHMIGFSYKSRWDRIRGRPYATGIVSAPTIPAKLDVHQTWIGRMAYNDKTRKARAAGHLYVGVIAAHSDRRFLLKVPPPTKVTRQSEPAPDAD